MFSHVHLLSSINLNQVFDCNCSFCALVFAVMVSDSLSRPAHTRIMRVIYFPQKRRNTVNTVKKNYFFFVSGFHQYHDNIVSVNLLGHNRAVKSDIVTLKEEVYFFIFACGREYRRGKLHIMAITLNYDYQNISNCLIIMSNNCYNKSQDFFV